MSPAIRNEIDELKKHAVDSETSKANFYFFVNKGIHCVANVYAVLPFYNVKCLCSGGRE